MTKKDSKIKIIMEDNKPSIHIRFGRFLIPLKRKRKVKYLIKDKESEK